MRSVDFAGRNCVNCRERQAKHAALTPARHALRGGVKKNKGVDGMGENLAIGASALLTAGAAAGAATNDEISTIIMTVANAIVLIINAVLAHKRKKKAKNEADEIEEKEE